MGGPGVVHRACEIFPVDAPYRVPLRCTAMIEIERKFLPDRVPVDRLPPSGSVMRQGYIAEDGGVRRALATGVLLGLVALVASERSGRGCSRPRERP